jgi:hypothetical protein
VIFFQRKNNLNLYLEEDNSKFYIIQKQNRVFAITVVLKLKLEAE